MALMYRPAKEDVCILSTRRQWKKKLCQTLGLSTGRGFRKFRKEAKQAGGWDYFAIPSFYDRPANT